jgi:hypothetical protein
MGTVEVGVVSGSTTPDRPPAAPYPIARDWIGLALPCFLLLGLWAEFSAEIKKLLFSISLFSLINSSSSSIICFRPVLLQYLIFSTIDL